MNRQFPDRFLWGAATAAHQVEGANDNNDWWDWEQTPGHILNGDTSTVACDWWEGERYRSDFDLAKTLNHNAHRLSVEWSRIEPRQGEWNADAITYYRRVLTALHERGMTPLVTLHHFTSPRWLAQKSAWETQAVVPLFERYAAHVVDALGDLCDFWVTLNEPIVFAVSGFNDGNFPPGKHDFFLAARVMGNMVRAHAAAYHAIHRVQPNARVGVAYHLRRFLPANPNSALDRFAVGIRDFIANRMFMRALLDGNLRFPMSLGERAPEALGTQDFIGINYYFTERIAFDFSRAGQLFARPIPVTWHAPVPGFAAEVNPRGLYDFVKEFGAIGKPLYITENGIFDLRDDTQVRYLVTHLAAVQQAIADGVTLKGYFYWTLADNFEWAEGFSARFGLFETDFETQVRTPRTSADVYARIARENGIADELLEQYGK